jgi:hypothetical protein
MKRGSNKQFIFGACIRRCVLYCSAENSAKNKKLTITLLARVGRVNWSDRATPVTSGASATLNFLIIRHPSVYADRYIYAAED